MILTAIGPELAAGFLRELAEPDMQRFARAISGLGKISQEVLDAVIVEFLELLTTGPEIAGGSKAARKLLAAVLDDEDEVQRLLDGRQRSEVRSVWERLNDTPAPTLATFVQAEHPQTAAVILSELRAEIAASVLERLDRAFAQTDRPAPVARPAPSTGPVAAVDPGRDRARLPFGAPAQPLEAPPGRPHRRPDEQHLDRGPRGLPRLPREPGARARPGRAAHDVHLRRHRAPRPRPRRGGHAARRARGGGAEGAEARRGPGQRHRRLHPRQPSPPPVRALRRGTRRPRPTSPARKGEAAQIEITKAIQAQAKAGAVRFIEKDAAFG